MPIYEYICDNDHKTERYQKRYTTRIICPICGKPADKIVSAGTSFILGGEGWPGKDIKNGK